MDLGLKNRVALVAASSQGIGKAVALEFAKEGAKVSLCARNEVTLQRAAEDIAGATGAEVHAVPADVTKDMDVEHWVDSTVKRFGRLDILVTNAGGPASTTFQTTPKQGWDEAYELTLRSTILLCRAAIPHMRKNKWGRIVNITSITVKQPQTTLILSNVMRSGVIALAKSLSNEFAEDNILVNSVCPGFTATERLNELAQTLAQKQGVTERDIRAGWEAQIPMERLGKPDEIAALVVFLASERASYITGTAIQVDGGIVKFLF